ncbi:phage terminase large subunit [Riemerella anatipestifer]|uniref:phage terminase large subunit n=1 Tax=Riemerella anatipestifer TaxID=34085 RepID=UPI001C6F33F7|nr:phage terminase large subunit [Riemerella anatipestifer]QYR02323.1 phage terminase large subunit [Riemerella anatipestifer]
MNNTNKIEKIAPLAYLVQADECKKSFFYFVKLFWKEIIPEIPVWNWHIPYLCDELQKVAQNVFDRKPKLHDLLINIPPGTTKSTIVTIMWPAWLWAVDPTIRIISNSYAADIATEHAIKSRDIINSKKYQKLFPYVAIRKDKSGKQAYDNTQNGARYTTSTGGAITGKHAHIIINDDPQNPKQAESEAHRKQAEDHTKTLSSRKVNKVVSVTVTVMQRLHEKDVSGYLLGKKGESIKHIKLPAEITEKTKPVPPELEDNYKDGLLDPVRLDRKALDEAKVDLGTRGYNGQFLENPTSEDGDIVKKEWFTIISRDEFYKLKSKQRTTIHFFMDTAYTDKSENDPTGIHASCKIGNNIYITDRRKVRKEFPELIKFVPDYVKSQGYDAYSTIRIEPKASGKSVVQTLKAFTKLNVVEIPAPTDDKKTRLHAASPTVESGRVFLVEGAWNEEFLEEVCGFPNASHDEDVDLLGYQISYHLNNNNAQEVQNILW